MGRRKHGLGLRVDGDVVRLRKVCRMLLALCKDLRVLASGSQVWRP